MSDSMRRDVARYRAITTTLLRRNLLDAEVDRYVDEKAAIVKRLRATGATVQELARDPYITVTVEDA